MHHQKLHQPKIHHPPLVPLHLLLNQNHTLHLLLHKTQPLLNQLTLDYILDAPPRPSNLLPLQRHPSLDITLSLSLITPLDHILDTPSPPSPPQPPIMGHHIYFNMFDYHGLSSWIWRMYTEDTPYWELVKRVFFVKSWRGYAVSLLLDMTYWSEISNR
ncbi:hypothetical protein Tco_1517451 [Tanacetum coccineum]